MKTQKNGGPNKEMNETYFLFVDNVINVIKHTDEPQKQLDTYKIVVSFHAISICCLCVKPYTK